MSAERKALWLCILIPAALAAGQDRIQSATDRSVSVLVKGNIAAQVAQSIDLGLLSPAARLEDMRIDVAPTAAQQADLDQLLEAQRDPTSPSYRQWLTPEEFGNRFGASDNDLAQVRSWLESEGFHVSRMARGHNTISFDGTAAQAQNTFRTEIHSYRHGAETHFANATEPRIPAAFASVVTAVHGLDDFRLRPATNRVATPNYTASNGARYLAPNDLATIYDINALYTAGYNGAGQKLAVMGQTAISLNDIRSFRAQFGLAASDPQLVLTGSNPGVSADDQVEADLDIEWAGAVARNATIVYVYSSSVFTSLNYAVDEAVAPVITMSYGGCETGSASSYRAIAQQANAEGITWFNASGDTGAAGCDYGATIAQNGPAVQFPSDIPEVTAVGGTEFSETGSAGWSSTNTLSWGSAVGYLSEKSWNDIAAGSALEASTGGASTVFGKPWWQSGAGVPNDGARDVPDISLSASANHDGFLIYTNGSLEVVGGTSASTPAFAGIATLINQYIVAKGLQSKPGLGNINPTLYNMAQTTTGVFHDITSGSNVVPCVKGTKGCTTGSFGFEAGAGYDLVTGLGSVDAFNLATKWNISSGTGATMTLSSATASLAPGATTQLIATVNPVSGNNAPTGSVTFRSGSVTFGSTALISNGARAAAQLTISASALASGANTITASYQPTGNFALASATATVSVTAAAVATSLTLTAAPASLTSAASTTLTATMKAATGSAAPSGSVTFTLGNTTLGTATLTASGTTSAAALTVKGSSLATGNNAITASYAATTGFTASIGTANVTVTQAPSTTATTASVIAAPAAIASSGSTQLTVTVKAASGSTAPTGSVSFTLGGTNLGTAALLASANGSGVALLAVKASSLAGGNNSIVATYGGSASFAGSTGSVTVTVSSPSSATNLTATSSAMSSTGTTQLTAIVTASGAASAPAGSVTFTAGATVLGSVTLTGAGTTAIAIMVVPGSRLAAGANSITASFGGSSTLTSSTSAPVNVTVTAAPVATTTVTVASAASITPTASTQLTVTVKAASGSNIPAGTVTATLGKTTLGTATLSASGAATITIAGSKLAVGANTISVAYAGVTGFNPSTGALTVTVK